MKGLAAKRRRLLADLRHVQAMNRLAAYDLRRGREKARLLGAALAELPPPKRKPRKTEGT